MPDSTAARERQCWNDFLAHIVSEAQYGLNNSHAGRPNGYCNARRQLQIIISAINQFNGIESGHPIGWAKPAGMN